MNDLDDHAYAAWLADRAGGALLALRDELGFGDPAALKDAGDKRSHHLLMSELRQARPDDMILSEEGAREDPARLTADRVWIVDPLDGTREFSEPGRTDWAVHVALWHRTGDPAGAPAGALAGVLAAGAVAAGVLVAGAVALPARGVVLRTDQPPARPSDVDRPTTDVDRPIRIACSRTRPPAFVAALAEQLGAELVPMGSAGVKVCAVVTGEVDAYVHAGGQYEWDSAAPVAVAQAAGVYASRIDGSPLVYNRANPSLPDLLVCRPVLADRILAVLRAVGTGTAVGTEAVIGTETRNG